MEGEMNIEKEITNLKKRVCAVEAKLPSIAWKELIIGWFAGFCTFIFYAIVT
jgi:hypothetical protein